MSLSKKILLGLMFLLYACSYYMVGRELRIILTILEGIIGGGVLIYYFIMTYKHTKLKSFFIENLSIQDKKVMHYGFHRCAYAEMGASSHPFSWYWRKEVEFQKKRNRAITDLDKMKGVALINLEKLLCDLEWLTVLIFLFFLLSFQNI